MASVDTGAGRVEVRATPLALMLYEQEFAGRSMVSDLLGVDGEWSVESGRWEALTRALWACMRAADESVPPFGTWARGAEGLDLWVLHDQLIPVVIDGLFRASGSTA